MYENITDILHRELERLDEKYAQEAKEISNTDLDVVDKVTHALKSMACLEEKRDAGRRGRYSRDGYYMERERRGY